jgi:hypothetical protein
MIQPPPNQEEFQSWNEALKKWIPKRTWVTFASDVFKTLASLQGAGTTAQRPTSFLWLGRPYFDTTLGYEIHWNGTIWVKYDGTAA